MRKEKTYALSILLTKERVTKIEDIVDVSACAAPINVPIAGFDTSVLYIKKSPPMPPRWAKLFGDFLTEKDLAVPHVSGVLVTRLADRFFAIVFGQGGRFLLKEDVYEERFGLLCALNTVDPSSFRSVDVQSLDAIQSHSRIQAGEATSPDQFGLDVEQDMLKAVVGTPKDSALGSRMTGSDSLSVSVKMTLERLPFLLGEYKKKFDAELRVEDHQWVNNISLVKKIDLIGALEAELLLRLNNRSVDHLWMSIPEVIDWTSVVGFTYSHGRREMHPDVTLSGFLKTLRVGDVIDSQMLRIRKVHCADENHQSIYRSWSVFRCIYAEIDSNGRKYILNDGKWFCVDLDFVARTNKDFAAIPHASFTLPDYSGGGEGEYNAAIAAALPQQYALLDMDTVQHGGGHGRVEVCDLLSAERQLIHVKLYGKSSVLSHLFSQGFVSGQLLQIDAAFRAKVKKKLAAPFNALIDEKRKPSEDKFTIVYAIVSTASGRGLHLPFFSRVNLNNVTKVLTGFGYSVELLKISVDDTFSRKTFIAPKKPRVKI